MIGQESMNQMIGQESMNQMIGQGSMNTVPYGAFEAQGDRAGQLFLAARVNFMSRSEGAI
jgi:hypothetical protein